MHSRTVAIKNLLVTMMALLAILAAQPPLLHASTWELLSPTTSPSARFYPAMAYDPVSKKVVLFGGGGNNANLNDTWVFDGTNWTEVTTSVAPPVRNGASMAFDRHLGKLVMFGGFDTNTYLQDTWLWDGATSTWTQVQMNSSPPKATGAMLFTDPLSGRAMMFGGYNANQIVPADSVTYRFTGTQWQRLNPSTIPIPRGWGIAVLDPILHNVVLTGGNGDTIRTDNTWTWDGKNWTQLFPATQIPAYVGAAAAFDPAVHAVVVFGALGDTWAWNGINWAQQAPSNSPSSRSEGGMVCDIASHQILLFGGQLASGPLTNETGLFIGP